MPHLPHIPWLWLFGALSLGIVVGWSTYLLAATRWNDRPTHIAAGAVAVGVLLAAAKVVPARYGTWLECGALLAVVGAIGCAVGWVLRDIADFTPVSTRPEVTASAVATGSYIYRDAFAGMGANPRYMRTTTGKGGPMRAIVPPNHDDLAKAPAPGGYTFPKTLPFADVKIGSQATAPGGLRPHWSWPVATQAAPATDAPVATHDAVAAAVKSSQAN